MPSHSLDALAVALKDRVQKKDAFAAKHGQKAAAFLDEMPALFQLYRRVPFDLDMPIDARRLASSVALYIAESQDFLPERVPTPTEKQPPETGLIDDVFVAYRALPLLVKKAGAPALARHWRGTTTFDELQGLGVNVGMLEDKVPSKVLEAAKKFLDVDG